MPSSAAWLTSHGALGFYRESNAPAPTNINTLVESAIDLLKGKITVKQATVEKQWRTHQNISAVAGELRQVLSNLLANSLDAIDARGTIKVRISSCTLRPGHRGVRITIADNGTGMEAACRTRVFEPLFTTKSSVGTGLGLWVAKQIIEKHRGSIQLRSSSNGSRRGSTFSVLLPL